MLTHTHARVFFRIVKLAKKKDFWRTRRRGKRFKLLFICEWLTPSICWIIRQALLLLFGSKWFACEDIESQVSVALHFPIDLQYSWGGENCWHSYGRTLGAGGRPLQAEKVLLAAVKSRAKLIWFGAATDKKCSSWRFYLLFSPDRQHSFAFSKGVHVIRAQIHHPWAVLQIGDGRSGNLTAPLSAHH